MAATEDLFVAVHTGDGDAITSAMRNAADPFAAVGPIEMMNVIDGHCVHIERGCAAAAAVRRPDVLAMLLPESMVAWPDAGVRANGLSLVGDQGQAMSLAHWALDMGCLASVELLIERLDRRAEPAQQALRRLTLSCLRGLSHAEAGDGVLQALVLCMAARPELAGGWAHWQNFRLAARCRDDEFVLLPLTYAMACSAHRGGTQDRASALRALAWALEHDEAVRLAERRCGNSNEDSLLHLGAIWGDLQVLRIALDAGCPPSALDAAGVTAREVALRTGHGDAAAFLDAWHADQAMRADLLPSSLPSSLPSFPPAGR